jgi:hypothetical protein
MFRCVRSEKNILHKGHILKKIQDNIKIFNSQLLIIGKGYEDQNILFIDPHCGNKSEIT